ncbi:MAG TPA: MBL fold metallo-hydrolase [Chryseolinea sp.]|nr:MBL fold metallo-hydrolase [Chryseolinea sp.]
MDIQFLPAGCGDAIHIRFEGSDNRYHNILIDGGAEQHDIYQAGVCRALVSIQERNESIDLWIITHIDDDHIGGILRFIQDETLRKGFDLSKTIFWYNAWHSDYPVKLSKSTQKSVDQGIRLREFLKSESILPESITNHTRLDFYGATITVLSPRQDQLGELFIKWQKGEARLIEKKRDTKKASEETDYDSLIQDFDVNAFSEDNSKENGSSIAFILSHQGKSVLFCADAHPSAVCRSLKELNYSESNRLVLEAMQVPHHGSKHNTNSEIIKLIDTNRFVISANGYNRSALPNKETLARIIHHCGKPEPEFYITHQNRRTDNIFESDKGAIKAKLNFPTQAMGSLFFYL